MIKWLMIAAVSGLMAISVANVVAPVVLNAFGQVAAALEFANRR